MASLVTKIVHKLKDIFWSFKKYRVIKKTRVKAAVGRYKQKIVLIE